MRTKFVVVVAAAVLLASAGRVLAHHSFSAEFDATKRFKFTGTVTKVEWMNPHTFFYIDVVDEKTKRPLRQIDSTRSIAAGLISPTHRPPSEAKHFCGAK